MKKSNHIAFFTVAIAATVFLWLLAGCTEYERRGYSPLPQNRPAEWETRPYGDFRN